MYHKTYRQHIDICLVSNFVKYDNSTNFIYSYLILDTNFFFLKNIKDITQHYCVVDRFTGEQLRVSFIKYQCHVKAKKKILLTYHLDNNS